MRYRTRSGRTCKHRRTRIGAGGRRRGTTRTAGPGESMTLRTKHWLAAGLAFGGNFSLGAGVNYLTGGDSRWWSAFVVLSVIALVIQTWLLTGHESVEEEKARRY